MGQVHMNAMQWIPFTLAYVHQYLDRGRRKDLLKALACLSLQALSSGHGAVFLGVALMALGAWRLAWGEPLRIGQRIRDVGVAGLVLLLPTVWLAAHYHAAQVDADLVRGYGSDSMPPLADFLASPSRAHQWFQALALGQPIRDQANAYLFPGLLVLLLAGLAFVPDTGSSATQVLPLRARMRQSVAGAYGLVAMAATSLFVSWPTNLWRYAFAWPGFNFIRVPARFVILALLGLAVLSNSAFERLMRGRSRGSYWTWTTALAMLLVAEYATVPFNSVPFTLEVPAIDQWLARQPTPFAFAEVPVPGVLAPERQQTQVMLHSTAHWQRTVHGYSGIRPPLHWELNRLLKGFPDESSVGRLRDLGVRYVVVHSEQYRHGEWPAVEARLAAFPGLRLLHVEGDGQAYEVVP
jgi:hypothetical protein